MGECGSSLVEELHDDATGRGAADGRAPNRQAPSPTRVSIIPHSSAVMNSTHMKWEFIENKENDDMGGVTDETWIVKR